MTVEELANSDQTAEPTVSLFGVGTLLLRWHRRIALVTLAGAAIGLASGLLRDRVYQTRTVFLPQVAEGSGLGGLAAAASQFGIRVAGGAGAGWSLLAYVEILRSQTLLSQVAQDTVTVTEEDGRKVALLDLLNVQSRDPRVRLAMGVERLRKLIAVRDVRTLGGVEIVVESKWPSVSYALARRMLSGINQFNTLVRKSQAGAERQFVEGRAEGAAQGLRKAEDDMQRFLQSNRLAYSPELQFSRDRLQRELNLRQAVYTSLVQNREDARIREVRDTPLITVIEEPRVPAIPQPRNTLLRGIAGVIVGFFCGVLLVWLRPGAEASPENLSADAIAFRQEWARFSASLRPRR